MNLKDLDVFVSVVAVGSLAGAGRRLGVSAMAISRSLAALETELGVRLMHRTTRSISLTPEGEAFLGHARALLDLGEAARSSVTSDPEIPSGTLKVTCPISSVVPCWCRCSANCSADSRLCRWNSSSATI